MLELLAGVSHTVEAPRPARRADVRRRQGGRHGGLHRQGLPGGGLLALHGVRLHRSALGVGPEVEEVTGRRHAQAALSHGVEAGGRGRSRGPCRSPGLYEVPVRVLAAHTHHQRRRAPQLRAAWCPRVVGAFPDSNSAPCPSPRGSGTSRRASGARDATRT